VTVACTEVGARTLVGAWEGVGAGAADVGAGAGGAGGLAQDVRASATTTAPDRRTRRSGVGTREACHGRSFHLRVPALLRRGGYPGDTR
jgi:hypothetical protein